MMNMDVLLVKNATLYKCEMPASYFHCSWNSNHASELQHDEVYQALESEQISLFGSKYELATRSTCRVSADQQCCGVVGRGASQC